jgi:hypothetical protein
VTTGWGCLRLWEGDGWIWTEGGVIGERGKVWWYDIDCFREFTQTLWRNLLGLEVQEAGHVLVQEFG